MRERVEIKIRITTDDVMDFHFQVTDTIYTKFAHLKGFKNQIYLAEKIMVEEQMRKSHITMADVVSVRYEAGLFSPYQMTSPATSSISGYIVCIFANRETESSSTVSIDAKKNELLRLFNSTPVKARKSLYRTLALQYHPDKEGGNEELMKYINKLKDQFIR